MSARDEAIKSVKEVVAKLINEGSNRLFNGDQSRDWWREFLDVTIPPCVETIKAALAQPMDKGVRPIIENAARKFASQLSEAQRIVKEGSAPPYNPNGAAVGNAILDLTNALNRLESDPQFAQEKKIGF